MRTRYSVQKRKPRDAPVEDKGMVLINIKTREIIKVGDKISNRNYERCVVLGGRAPVGIGDNGKVHVSTGRWKMDFDPSVFSLRWVPVHSVK
jgi:hypothetical protein